MDPLALLIVVAVLYALGIALQRAAAGRRRARPPAPARPPEAVRRPARRPPVQAARPEPALEEAPRPAPPRPATEAVAPGAPADVWRRRLARPEALRDAVVAAEILARRRWRPGLGSAATGTPAPPSPRRDGGREPGAPP